ncbi:hypothetical protein ACU4GD_22745 [Cupriavidus basilensis]
MEVTTRAAHGSVSPAVETDQLPSAPVVVVVWPLTHLIRTSALVMGAPVDGGAGHRGGRQRAGGDRRARVSAVHHRRSRTGEWP